MADMRKLYVFAVLSLYLLARLPGLGFDMLNSDGIRWHRRSEKFMSAIKRHDFASTYQHYQPGVTLMWINSATKKIVWEIQDLRNVQRWSLENSEDFPKIHAVSKVMVVLILSAIFLYQLWIISKLTSAKTALLYGLILATEPYIIGIDRWFHLTSLESYLAFSAYLTYVYSFNRRKGIILITAGFLTALAVLSKFTAIIVLPLMLLMEFVYGIKTKQLRRPIVGSISMLLGFVVVISILFPALWVDFNNVVSKTANAITLAVKSDARDHYFKPPITYIYYLLIPSYKLSPGLLIAFLVSVMLFIKRGKERGEMQNYFILAYLLTFILVLTLSSKKIDRYALALFQPLILFTAISVKRLGGRLSLGLVGLQVVACGFLYWCNYPVLSGYYSPVFGGAQKALDLGVYENSGEYFAQAAHYINNLDSSEVYVPDNYDSFKYFYSGTAVIKVSPNTRFAVTSVDFDRKSPRNILGCDRLEKTFGPKLSRPVVYVFRCRF